MILKKKKKLSLFAMEKGDTLSEMHFNFFYDPIISTLVLSP